MIDTEEMKKAIRNSQGFSNDRSRNHMLGLIALIQLEILEELGAGNGRDRVDGKFDRFSKVPG